MYAEAWASFSQACISHVQNLQRMAETAMQLLKTHLLSYNYGSCTGSSAFRAGSWLPGSKPTGLAPCASTDKCSNTAGKAAKKAGSQLSDAADQEADKDAGPKPKQTSQQDKASSAAARPVQPAAGKTRNAQAAAAKPSDPKASKGGSKQGSGSKAAEKKQAQPEQRQEKSAGKPAASKAGNGEQTGTTQTKQKGKAGKRQAAPEAAAVAKRTRSAAA